MSVRVQVTLPEEVARVLKREAAQRKVSLARIVRDALSERTLPIRKAKRGDPFAWLPQLPDCEDTDLSSRVDEILYR